MKIFINSMFLIFLSLNLYSQNSLSIEGKSMFNVEYYFESNKTDKKVAQTNNGRYKIVINLSADYKKLSIHEAGDDMCEQELTISKLADFSRKHKTSIITNDLTHLNTCLRMDMMAPPKLKPFMGKWENSNFELYIYTDKEFYLKYSEDNITYKKEGELTIINDFTILLNTRLVRNTFTGTCENSNEKIRLSLVNGGLENASYNEPLRNHEKDIEEKKMQDFENLEELDLSGKRLTSLPDNICKYKKLTQLDISENNIKSIPENIGCLSTLTNLYFYENSITSIPESIGELKNLTIINAGDNKLSSLPASLWSLDKLKSLFLSRNMLTSISDSIKYLVNLERLDIDNNKFLEFPEAICQLENLKIIYLSKNPFLQIPDQIQNLKSIENFTIDNSPISSLPASIGKLTTLNDLSIYETNLQELPTSIGHLLNLKRMFLVENKLTALPKSICNLKNLESLTLDGNKISQLPEEIAKLTNLKWLDLRDNPITAEEKERLKKELPNCKITF